jgi:hypothetical protein
MIASIETFGFKIPLLVTSSGELVDGHLRMKAAEKLGMTEVPVILCDDLSSAQIKAFRHMVNRSASWAEFDLELVALELKELKAIDFDLRLTGFHPLEINRMLLADAPQESHLPENLGGAVVTTPGDVWICGRHRIGCGDATSKESVTALLGGAKPVLMLIDPPYGIGYDPEWRGQAGLGAPRQVGKVTNDHRVDWTEAYELFPGDVAYVSSQIVVGVNAGGVREVGKIVNGRVGDVSVGVGHLGGFLLKLVGLFPLLDEPDNITVKERQCFGGQY